MGDEEQSLVRRICTVEFATRYWKQLLLLAFFICLIVFIIVDFVAKPCTLFEMESDRVQRLFCDGIILADGNGTVLPGQPFTCGNVTSDWAANSDLTKCQQASACINVGLNAFIEWIADNVVVGVFACAAGYAVAALLIIPGSILTIGSGAAFTGALGLGLGVLVGTVTVLIGASIAMIISFIIGRFLLRETIQVLMEKYKVIRAIDHSFRERGFFVVLLLRFSPVIPFSAFNYLMGGTGTSFRDYTLASIIGIIPGTTAYVFIGGVITAAANGGDMDSMIADDETIVTIEACETQDRIDVINLVIIIVGLVLTLIALFLISRVARKQFLMILEEEGVNEQGEKVNDSVVST